MQWKHLPAPDETSGSPVVSASGRVWLDFTGPTTREPLSGIFPDQQGGAHVHIERADDPLLGDLHAHIQHLEQVGWYAFSFIAAKGSER